MAFDANDVSATPKPIGTFKLIPGSDGQLMDCSGKVSVMTPFFLNAKRTKFIDIYRLHLKFKIN